MIITERVLGVEATDFTRCVYSGYTTGRYPCRDRTVLEAFCKTTAKRQLEFLYQTHCGCSAGIVARFIFSDKIDELLDNATVVAITMIAGGVVLLFIDNLF